MAGITPAGAGRFKGRASPAELTAQGIEAVSFFCRRQKKIQADSPVSGALRRKCAQKIFMRLSCYPRNAYTSLPNRDFARRPMANETAATLKLMIAISPKRRQKGSDWATAR
jgi:hypothetical protein